MLAVLRRLTSIRGLGALALSGGLAASAVPPAAAQAPASLSATAWDRVPAAAPAPAPGLVPALRPERFAAFDLDRGRLGAAVADAPAERSRAARSAPLVVSLPSPDGSFERFRVVDSPVMEPGLAARHPEIRTYAGHGIDDPTAGVRFDLTPLGVHATVRGAGRDWFIDPRYTRDDTRHVSYFRADLEDPRDVPFVERELAAKAAELPPPTARAPGGPVELRTYGLALLSDPTYAENSPGTTTTAKAVLVNRVNQLYGADLAIRMVLIANNDALNLDTAAAATGAPGPCGIAPCFEPGDLDSCTGALLDRLPVAIGRLVGANSFDMGHVVLGNAGGGIAALGAVGTPSKAEGCTGVPNPVGDAFAVDYVAHEMGHQFSGDHTFNGVADNCSGENRAPGSSVEPGSGSSVMAYAGICGQDDLQAHSDPYFSQRSIEEMTTFTETARPAGDVAARATLGLFDAAESFKISFDADGAGSTPSVSSTVIRRGANYDRPGVETAIEALAGVPAGGVTVTSLVADLSQPNSLSDRGFTVTFEGTASVPFAGTLDLVDVTGGARGFASRIFDGGVPTNRGASTFAANRSPSVTVPRVSATIPRQTPFTLTATGGDLDGDLLTYLWEQNDVGSSIGTALTDPFKASGPLFRVFGTAARYPLPNGQLSPSPGANLAGAVPTRSFPDVRQVMADNTNADGDCPKGVAPDDTVDCYSEWLPTADYLGSGFAIDRTLHFRVTARDNAPAGGTASAGTALTVAPGAGPFRLTSQATTTPVLQGSTLPVSWDVAWTNVAPVSTANVRILLSTDDGATFPTVLAAATPNDGSQNVPLPAGVTTEAGRIRIEAVDNVFYDASRGRLRLVAVLPPDPPAPPPAEPQTVTVTQTTAAPAPPPPPPPTVITTPAGPAPRLVLPPDYIAYELARGTLKATPLLVGTVGSVRLYVATTSTALGRPSLSRRLVVAVCLTRPCTVESSATLVTRRRGGAARRAALKLPRVAVPANAARFITLRMSAANRRTVRRARSATVALVVRSGGKRLARTYRFRVG